MFSILATWFHIEARKCGEKSVIDYVTFKKTMFFLWSILLSGNVIFWVT